MSFSIFFKKRVTWSPSSIRGFRTYYSNLRPSALHKHVPYAELCSPLRRSKYCSLHTCNNICNVITSTHHIRTSTSPTTLHRQPLHRLQVGAAACMRLVHGSHLLHDPSTDASATLHRAHTHRNCVCIASEAGQGLCANVSAIFCTFFCRTTYVQNRQNEATRRTKKVLWFANFECNVIILLTKYVRFACF
jgi:hypothetical protein